MKRIIIYVFVFLQVITMVLIVINKKSREEKYIEDEEIEEKNIIEYKANETIRVKMHETGEVVAMDLNDYLRGVLPAEMSPKYELEALKAQAVVARTYTYKKIMDNSEGENVDICDYSAHCQAYYPKEKIYSIWENKGYTKDEITSFWNKINEAVVSTEGEVIIYMGELANAYFHASSPEGTEDVSQIWCNESFPYLVSVESEEDESYENRTSKNVFSFNNIAEKLNQDNSLNYNINVDDIKNICINEYTTSGRVKNIKIKNVLISAEKLRLLFGLKSTKFSIEVDNQKQTVIFNVIGYGHGIGMSQVGADTYAKKGMKYDEIIKHYYRGVEIKNISK